MKIQVVSKENCGQHRLAMASVVEELKIRGHKIIDMRGTFYGGKEVDCTLTSHGFGRADYSKATVKSPTKPWFFIPHGASGKHDAISGFPAFNLVLASSKFWVDYIKTYTKVETKTSHRIAIGYPKTDYLIRNKHRQEIFREKVYREHKFNKKKPLVIFAPTWTHTKHSNLEGGVSHLLPEVEKQISKLDINFLVLKHELDRVLQIPSIPDKRDYLLAADLMIGDISSIIYEFLILDKPVIRLKSGIPFYYCLYQKKDMPLIEIGDIISIVNLAQCIETNLKMDRFKEQREYWLNIIVGVRDGKSTKRAVEAIEEYMK